MARTKAAAKNKGARKRPARPGHKAIKGASKTRRGQPQEKKKRRFRPGTVARRRVRKAVRQTRLVLPKASFQRCLRSAMQEHNPDMRITSDALEHVQTIVEDIALDVAIQARVLMENAGRSTLKPTHVRDTLSRMFVQNSRVRLPFGSAYACAIQEYLQSCD